jgi:hydroxymethylpyrimidine/phosphomethylpyrimidine kinase
MNTYPVVLSIAGSDSGGGAGIQADIKSISANGAYAATALTAITSQNTQGVQDIFSVPVEHISSQIHSVLSDIGANAIKIGMLHSPAIIAAVKRALGEYNVPKIVLDPVMVATSGDRLLQEEAIEALKAFIPSTTIITPNIPEAEILMDTQISDQEKMFQVAPELGKKYKVSVLLKAGHLRESPLVDALYCYPDDELVLYESQRIQTNNTHGTGCTLSSAIAANLAKGDSLTVAVRKATHYLHAALEAGSNKKLGKGSAPVNHFYNFGVQ